MPAYSYQLLCNRKSNSSDYQHKDGGGKTHHYEFFHLLPFDMRLHNPAPAHWGFLFAGYRSSPENLNPIVLMAAILFKFRNNAATGVVKLHYLGPLI